MPRMTVNNRPVEFDLDPEMPLLYALREAANLTGTKSGGGEEDCSCGVCMVIVDGTALRSCQITLAEAEGRLITTIEGLSEDRSHPVQQAMVAEQAIQCGFCTPGIVMAAAALIQRNPNPERGEIEQAITNLCRCGVYPRLVRVVERAGQIAQDGNHPTSAPAPGISTKEAAKEIPAFGKPLNPGKTSDE